MERRVHDQRRLVDQKLDMQSTPKYSCSFDVRLERDVLIVRWQRELTRIVARE